MLLSTQILIALYVFFYFLCVLFTFFLSELAFNISHPLCPSTLSSVAGPTPGGPPPLVQCHCVLVSLHSSYHHVSLRFSPGPIQSPWCLAVKCGVQQCLVSLTLKD